MSKEQGNLSGNPKLAAHPFELLPKLPCPCRGLSPIQYAPDGHMTDGAVERDYTSSPDGRFRFVSPECPNTLEFSKPKM
ncbi:hypothetical protein [Dysgonomonas gadei]|uniref:hypothetical protein n=1 Tax=Dysgonomonas gadei TaxID=156974 RepID=UPI0011DE5953|nr:hypothetical protein [Dysgonomonas gadei]